MNKLEQKLTSIMFSLGWDGEYPSDWNEIDKLGWLLDTIKKLVTDEQSKLGLHFKIESELPETGEDDYFYLVPAKNEVGQDIYAEYLWIEDKFEKLGSTDIKIENYFTKEEINEIIKTVNDSLADESATREAADDKIKEDLNVEITERKTADETIQDSLNAEIKRAKEKEDSLDSALALEITNREDADTSLKQVLDQEIDDALSDGKKYIDSKIELEASERSIQDTALDEKISNLSSDLASEITNRTTADKELKDYLDTEVTNRTNADADLTASISSLSTTVGENYTLLNTNLNAEITRAKTEESRIEENCTSKEKELTKKIEDSLAEAKSYTDTSISTEASARSTKDDELQKNIDAANLKIEATASAIRQEIPTKVSQLENDCIYITKDVDDLTNYYSSTTIDEKLVLKLDADKLPTKLSAFENDENFIDNTVADLANYTTTADLNKKLDAYAKTADLKTKLSEFENDSKFIDSTVDSLENYYLKTEVDSKLADKLDSVSASETYETKESASASYTELKEKDSSQDSEIANLKSKDAELKSEIDEKQAKSDDTLETTSKEIVGAINEINTAISSETTRAKEKESALQDSIDAEATRAAAKELELENSVYANKANITTLTTDLTSEISDRKEADNTLQDNITAEATRATDAETVLDKAINDEISRAQNAEDTNAKAITAEASRAEREEGFLQTNIESESTRAQNQEKLLQSNINGVEDSLSAKISTNASSITELKTSVSDLTSKHATDIASLNTSVSSETARAKEAENTLTESVAAINNKIPSQASESNQLADKDFVNSSIATSTATFQGTVDSKEKLKALTGDLNDYAYIKTVDAVSGLVTQYDRYKYSESVSEETGNWAYEYTLNNSSFTEAQWKAIVSGITEELVEKITSNESNISSETTRAKEAESKLSSSISNETTRATAAEKTNSEAIAEETTRAKNAEAQLESSITNGDDSTLATAKEYTDSKVITDYVTLSTDQAISGTKSFSKDITVPNIYQSAQSPEYSTFSSTCGITPRWFSTCGGDDGTFFIIDLSNTSFPFVDMFVGGNNETPTQKWAAIYDESGTLSYAINAVEMELRIHKHRIDQKYADVYITDHRDGKMVNDSVSGGYVVVYSTKNLMFEGYVGTSDNFYSTTKPSWFDASALSEKYNSRFVLKDDFDALVARVAALENTADKEY